MVIDGIDVVKGLIIRQPWLELILSGDKVWEMRSYEAKHRGPIALIQQGTNLIVGVANMTDVLPQMSIDALMALKDKHKIDYPNTPEAAKWLTPWVIEDVKRITPITYDKSGPVVWVCL